MIKIISLIPASLAYLAFAGCGNDAGTTDTGISTDTSISGAPSGADDPLKQLQEEGKLPTVGTGPKSAPSTASNTDSLSLYPPSVDPDQDNVPSSAITGHPEIAVDNCPNVFNPGQEDADHNGVGDAC